MIMMTRTRTTRPERRKNKRNASDTVMMQGHSDKKEQNSFNERCILMQLCIEQEVYVDHRTVSLQSTHLTINSVSNFRSTGA